MWKKQKQKKGEASRRWYLNLGVLGTWIGRGEICTWHAHNAFVTASAQTSETFGQYATNRHLNVQNQQLLGRFALLVVRIG
jgi:hypothetical protein